MPNSHINETDSDVSVETSSSENIYNSGVCGAGITTSSAMKKCYTSTLPLEHSAAARNMPIVEDIPKVDPDVINALQFWFGDHALIKQKIVE